MHGPLSEIGLIEVLQLLERGGKSGMLRVTGATSDDEYRLRIADGEIVAFEPVADDAATRRGLLARHLIAAAEPDAGSGLLLRPAGRTIRTELAARELAAMLHVRHGRFDFEAAAPEPGPLAISPDALVVDLVGTEMRRAELAATLDDFRAVPDFVPGDALASGVMPELSSRDWRLLDQVDGVRDVVALAEALDEPVEAVATSVQSLRDALILQVRRPTADATEVARRAIEAGQYEDAAALLRARLADQPDDVDAWRALGLTEVAAGRFERAIDAWQHWRANDPERADDAVALMQAARTMVEALRDARD